MCSAWLSMDMPSESRSDGFRRKETSSLTPSCIRGLVDTNQSVAELKHIVSKQEVNWVSLKFRYDHR